MDNVATPVTSTRTNRWIPVIASIAIQLCLGTAYIWSVFQSYLIKGKSTPDALFDWPATHGTLAYALLLGVLAIGSTIGGRLQPRFQIRTIIITAGVVLGLGFFLAQFTTQEAPWVLPSMSLEGSRMTYNTACRFSNKLTLTESKPMVNKTTSSKMNRF